MMKKRASCIILLVVVLGLCACGLGGSPQEETQENQTEPVQESVTEPEHKNEEEPSSEQGTEADAESFLEVGEPKENATGEIGFENTEEEQQAIYYERYYAKWDEDEMIAEMNNRRVYLDNCSFYEEANQFIENVLGNRDISSLVEPLFPLDMVLMEKEDFEDFPPLMIHILKNEIYAMHGYIFQDEDLDNYFRGLLWYTPQYEAADFDDSVFNEIERHNLDILVQLDTY